MQLSMKKLDRFLNPWFVFLKDEIYRKGLEMSGDRMSQHVDYGTSSREEHSQNPLSERNRGFLSVLGNLSRLTSGYQKIVEIEQAETHSRKSLAIPISGHCKISRAMQME